MQLTRGVGAAEHISDVADQRLDLVGNPIMRKYPGFCRWKSQYASLAARSSSIGVRPSPKALAIASSLTSSARSTSAR
ncbi:Uncharacterised protein [Mycobacteroides abscessus subsp. massiliense]|nr:Uncharacterised protein [Mycobacteroides abscessus subsp. massiliense]